MKHLVSNFDGNKVFWIAVIVTTLLGMPLIAVIMLLLKFCFNQKGEE